VSFFNCKVVLTFIKLFSAVNLCVDVDFVLVLDWIDPSVNEKTKPEDIETEHFSPVSRAIST
jgi:hypothetical protein